MPSHFHSARYCPRSSFGRSASSSGCASISGRKTGTAPASSGRGALPFEPGEEVEVGRLQPVPDLLDLAGLDPAQAGQRQPGEPGRGPDPQAAGDQLEQRPAAGGVQPVEPAGDQLRQLGPACGDKRPPPPPPAAASRPGRRPRAPARPAPPSRRGRPRSRRTRRTAPGRCAWSRARAPAPGLACAQLERAGQRRQPPAAVRVGHAAEIVARAAPAWRCAGGCRAGARAARRRASTRASGARHRRWRHRRPAVLRRRPQRRAP